MNNSHKVSFLKLLSFLSVAAGIVEGYIITPEAGSYHYLSQNEWTEIRNDPHHFTFPADRHPVLDEAWGLTEVSSIFPGWKKYRFVPASDAVAILTAIIEQDNNVFVSPVLKDTDGRDKIVPSSVIHVIIPFDEEWPATFSKVHQAVGDILSVRAIVSPLGTESEAWEYFSGALAPLNVVKSPHHIESVTSGFPDFEQGIPEGRSVVFAVETAATNGWQVFDMIEQIAGIDEVTGAAPDFMSVIGFSSGYTSSRPRTNHSKYYDRQALRYLSPRGWLEIQNQLDSFYVNGDRQNPNPNEWDVTEETSTFPGWVRYGLNSEADDLENSIRGIVESTEAFVTPVLKDTDGRDKIVPSSVIHVIIPFDEEWPATFSKVHQAVGDILSVRAIVSPLGTESEAWEYFSGALAPLNVVKSPHHIESVTSGFPDFEQGIPEGRSVVFAVETAATNGWQVFDMIEQIAGIDEVTGAAPDFMSVIRFAMPAPFSWPPNDPDIGDSWHLEFSNNNGLNIGPAWGLTYGYSSVRVAVLDTGIQSNHPDLHLAHGQNFANDQASSNYDPSTGTGGEYENHGTTVAGVISQIANNNTLTAGVAPNVRVSPLRIARFNEEGGVTVLVSWIVNAINWARDNKIRVTNSSFEAGYNAAIESAYNAARNDGDIVHFASTGNSNDSSISFPSSLDSVIAVGATEWNGNRWDWASNQGSNYGSGMGVVAPGVFIMTTDRTGSDGYESGDFHDAVGTSYASPATAALAALIISRNPRLTASQIENAITSTTRDLGASGYDTEYGYGLIRPHAALNSVTEGLWIRANAFDAGGGWKWQARFKYVMDEPFPAYYHHTHGWQIAISDDPDDFWFYDVATETWWWTKINDPVYPAMNRNGTDWYLYNESTTYPTRMFYHYATSQWISEDNL